MAMWMGRQTETVTQMGGEGQLGRTGALYQRVACVCEFGRRYLFSLRVLAIRQAIAAKVNGPTKFCTTTPWR